MEGTPATCSLWHEEVFAPAVMLAPFETLDHAIEIANDPEYSLRAGIFTGDLPRLSKAPGALTQAVS